MQLASGSRGGTLAVVCFWNKRILHHYRNDPRLLSSTLDTLDGLDDCGQEEEKEPEMQSSNVQHSASATQKGDGIVNALVILACNI